MRKPITVGIIGSSAMGGEVARMLIDTKEHGAILVNADIDNELERGIVLNEKVFTITNPYLITKLNRLPETRAERRQKERKNRKK